MAREPAPRATAALAVPVSGHRLPSCERRREGRPGLPGSQGGRDRVPRAVIRTLTTTHTLTRHRHTCVLIHTHLKMHTHTHLPVHAHTCHVHTCPPVHTETRSAAHAHTQAHAHPHVCMLTFILTCVHPHTHQFALKHTHRHAPTPRWCAHTHSLQGLRGPSVGDPVPWARQPGCR